MPPRAAAVLAGHAIPLGDTANWPLDDTQIIDFEKTLKLRKRISAAANLYKVLCALTTIAFVVMLIVYLVSGLVTRNRRSAVFLPDNLTGIGVTIAFGLLYFFAYQATRKSKRWAPITMLVVFIVCGLIQVVSMVFTSSFAAPGSGVAFAAPTIFLLAFVAAFAYVSGRAMVAIPQYLNQPAWCQELVVKAGL
jgi:1,4-dihydroxy-2-naphthoate octaprenyltransferase